MFRCDTDRVRCLFVLFILLTCTACRPTEQEGEAQNTNVEPKVAIVFTEPHPVLSEIIDAFQEAVRRDIPGAMFIQKHGSGSKAQYPAVVRAAIQEQPHLLVSITTPMSIESLKQARGRVPLLFLGVTDPIGAELVADLRRPQYSSGVSDNPPMEGVIELIQQFLPKAKVIGIPYDPKDQPAVITAKRTLKIAESRGLKAELLPVTSETEIRAAVRSLASRADALVIGMDNLMMKNAGISARTAAEASKPIFAADDKSVEMGALAGVGVNYADVGRIGGEMAVRFLAEGAALGEMPVSTLTTGDIFYNEAMAGELGIEIPQALKSKGRPLKAQ